MKKTLQKYGKGLFLLNFKISLLEKNQNLSKQKLVLNIEWENLRGKIFFMFFKNIFLMRVFRSEFF